MYGRTVRALRQFTQQQLNREPAWRHARPERTTGYREEE
jgi:hydrogenase small subunit